ncbi:MAG: translocation/assembly module TamB domain-containing protein [Sulfurimonas sp.]
MPGLKKILYLLLFTAAALLTVLVVAVNTPVVINEAAKRLAPRYDISYEKITGNVFQGITIHAPAYQGSPIAKSIALRWNAAALLEKRVRITRMELLEVRVDTLLRLADSLSGSSQSSQESQPREAGPLSLVIDIENLRISLLPFTQKGIAFTKAGLSVKHLILEEKRFDIEALDLQVDSNITDLVLQGSYADKKAEIASLSLKNTDLPALQALLNALEEPKQKSTEAAAEDAEAWYLPDLIVLDHIDLGVKSSRFDPVSLEALSIVAEKVKVDPKKLIVEEGTLLLGGRTNLGDLTFQAALDDNSVLGRAVILPKQRLFELYDIPVRKEAVKSVEADINATLEKVVIALKTSAEEVLAAEKGAFNFDIDSWESELEYDIRNNRLMADSSLRLSTPYSDNILLTNHALIDETISYSGEVEIKELTGLDANLSELLKNIRAEYDGDEKNINARILSEHLKGSFAMQGYRKGRIKLETKESFRQALHDLPEMLKDEELRMQLDVPFEIDANQTLKAEPRLLSNLLEIDTDIMMDKTLRILGKANLPEESLIRSVDPDIRWDALVPLDMNITLAGETLEAVLGMGGLRLQAAYGLSDRKVAGRLEMNALKAEIRGELPQTIRIDASIDSFASLRETISSYYRFSALPEIEGSAEAKISMTDAQKIELSLQSPSIIYRAGRTAEHIFDRVSIALALEETQLTVRHYDVTYNKQRIYATKPSLIRLAGDEVEAAPLFINDRLALTGKYALKTKQGNIDANATLMPLKHAWADILCDVDMAAVFDGNRTDVKGEIVLQGGRILYDVSQKTFASDSDIIIVQEIQKEESGSFADHLSSAVHIKTGKPLLFKQAGIDIQAKADLTVYKAVKEPLLLLGSVELMEGGSYLFQDKRFVLKKSFVYFTGDSDKPLLEIKAGYQSLKYFITITVTGTPDAPTITFSSNPSLTKEQILSVILFDSEGGGNSYSDEEMMKMMGGAIAQSVLKNVGIKIDHLALGEGNSIEVGKKLTRDITIIYSIEEKPKAELKYRHSNQLESVIGASEESSSYDIIYTKDFK